MNESEEPIGETESKPIVSNGATGRGRMLLLALIVLALVPFLIPTVTRIGAGLLYPYQLDSEEGFVLWQAWQLRQGNNIFRPLDKPPYVAATYAPVYPVMSAATLWGDLPSFFGGRLIAALSVLAICALMAAIVWIETRSVLPALIGPLLFLNTYDVYSWLPFYRVDFAALAIGLAGMYFLMQWRRCAVEEGPRTGKSVVRFRAACFCFVAMVYTKQVEIWPLVAAFLYLLIVDRRAAWRLFRNVALWGIAIAAILALLTKGQFLVHNIYYNANPFKIWQLQTMLRHFWGFHRFFVIAVGLGVVWLAVVRPWRERAGRDGFLLFAIYAAVASIGLLGLGKVGAATNYIIEPKAALSLFVAFALGRMLDPERAVLQIKLRRVLFAAISVFLLIHSIEFLFSSTFHLAHWPRSYIPENRLALNYLMSRPPVLLSRDNRNPTIIDRLNGDRIVAMMRSTQGPVFSEHAIFPMLAGREVYIQPFIMSQLAREEKWDQGPVVEALRAGRFAWVVSTENILKDEFLFHYTEQMASAIRGAYRLEETLAGAGERPATITHYVYVPKGKKEFE